MDTDQLQERVLHVRDSFSVGGKSLTSITHKSFQNIVLLLYVQHSFLSSLWDLNSYQLLLFFFPF